MNAESKKSSTTHLPAVAFALLLGVVAAGVSHLASNRHDASRSVQQRADPTSTTAVRRTIHHRAIKLAAEKSEPLIQTDPTAADYDPLKLLALVSADELHAAEPRDEAWASAVEQRLAPLLSAGIKEVVPEVASVTFECRTTTCAIGWQLSPNASSEANLRLREVTRQLYPGSGRTEGSKRFVVWQDPTTNKPARGTDFLPIAAAHMESVHRFFRSPEGQQYLATAIPRR